MASTKNSLEFANNAIREIRQDITLYGANSKAYLYLSKKTGGIIDYSPAAAEGKIRYFDEKRVETTLFNVLWNYIAAAKAERGVNVSPVGVWVTTARLCLDLTEAQFAEKIGATASTVQSWEIGARNPKITKLLALAQTYGFPTEIFFM